MRKLIASVALASTLAAAAPLANAATASYSFTQCLTGSCSSISGSVGTLTMNDIVGGVSFSFTSNTSSLGASSYIRGFYFNGLNGTLTWLGPQPLANSVFSTTASSQTTNANGYNWDLTFPTSGSNPNKFLSGDSAAWRIMGAGLDVTDFATPNKFALDLAGLTSKGNKTGWVGGVGGVLPVPEPGTYAMFLSGLIVIGGMARRRKA